MKCDDFCISQARTLPIVLGSPCFVEITFSTMRRVSGMLGHFRERLNWMLPSRRLADNPSIDPPVGEDLVEAFIAVRMN
jgi:hypothetical protein